MAQHLRGQQAEEFGEGFFNRLMEDNHVVWAHTEGDKVNMVLANDARQLVYVEVKGVSAAGALLTEHELVTSH